MLKVTAVTYDDGRGTRLREPARLFFDRSSKELFIADAANHRLVILDTSLLAVHTFDHFVTERQSGKMVKGQPTDVVVSSRGEMFVADALVDYIDVLDFRGQSLEQIYPNRLLGDTTLRIKPTALAIDNDDNLYLIITGDKTTIMVLDASLNLVRTIGEVGTWPENFSTPSAVGVYDGRVYVADMQSEPAVKIFDADGTYLSGFASHDIDREDLSLPQSFGFIIVSGKLTIWVLDTLRQVIKIYSPDGGLVFTIGGVGTDLGKLQFPSGISTDYISTAYVSEKVGGRVQKFQILNQDTIR
jgi:DNA-binding beta-propeller fold protein YncE